MIILKDNSGIRYELTKRTLSETPYGVGKRSRYVILKELLLPVPKDEFYEGEVEYGATPVRYRDSQGRMAATKRCYQWLRNLGMYSIGCRTFKPAEYKKIMAAAKGAK